MCSPLCLLWFGKNCKVAVGFETEDVVQKLHGAVCSTLLQMSRTSDEEFICHIFRQEKWSGFRRGKKRVFFKCVPWDPLGINLVCPFEFQYFQYIRDTHLSVHKST